EEPAKVTLPDAMPKNVASLRLTGAALKNGPETFTALNGQTVEAYKGEGAVTFTWTAAEDYQVDANGSGTVAVGTTLATEPAVSKIPAPADDNDGDADPDAGAGNDDTPAPTPLIGSTSGDPYYASIF
ncbi:MAG: hypothetical protein VYE81_06655, partial [Planctomycetota bacterium]|nr:hypothetical protein [Planctomycetota bacterium]